MTKKQVECPDCGCNFIPGNTSPKKKQKGLYCPHCSSPMKVRKHSIMFHGIRVGPHKLWQCTVCKRFFYSSETSIAIEKELKKRWGLCSSPIALIEKIGEKTGGK